jgi:hypothetical protein
MQHKDSTATAEILDAQSGNGETQSLYELQAQYWLQYEEHDRAMKRADGAAGGSAEEETAEAAQYEASDRLHETGCAILAFIPRRRYEARIKVRFAEHLAGDNNGTFESDEVTALLSSLSGLVAWRDVREDDAGVVSRFLSKLLAEHAAVTAAINRHKGDPDHPEVDALCKRQVAKALEIIGYRPLTKEDERRKAEFLREWTDGALLNEEEQNALIASMLPEGGAA